MRIIQRYTYLIICLLTFCYLGVFAQSGNVGIGTSDPSSKLHIRSAKPNLTLESNDQLEQSAGSELISRISFRGQKNFNFRDAAYIQAVQNGTWSTNSLTFAPTSLQFFTQSFGSADGLVSPRMVISSAGNVGIGTASPRVKLHLSEGSAGTFSGNRATTTLIESDTANYLNLFNPVAYESGIRFGFPSDQSSGGLLYNASNTPQGLQFRTNGDNTRMVINNEGKVGIGTNSPAYEVHVSKGSLFATMKLANENNLGVTMIAGEDFWALYHSDASNDDDLGIFFSEDAFLPAIDDEISLGTENFRWSEVFASNAMVNTSDRNLKKNIENLDYGLREVMQMRPVSYQWKNEEKGRTMNGFIAQEMEEVIPEVVHVAKSTFDEPKYLQQVKGNSKDLYGLRYTELIPVLTKAIQEQQKLIEALKQRIEVLEAK